MKMTSHRAEASSLHVKCVLTICSDWVGDCPRCGWDPGDQTLRQVEHRWCPDQWHLSAGNLQQMCKEREKKMNRNFQFFAKRGLESHLDIDQLAMCARAFVEEHVSVYSLAVVCGDPVNHRLRHTLSYVKYLNVFRSLQAATLTLACFPTGLHCREREVRQVPATLWRTLCCQAFPQGPVPHCGASDQLHDDARPQQRQEADDCPHCQARFWDHPPADGRGMELGSMHPVSPLTPGVTYRVSKMLNLTTRLWVLSDVG